MEYILMSLLMPIAVLTSVLLIFISKKRTKHDFPANGDPQKYAPRSQLGLAETIKMITSRDRLFLILKEARNLRSHVFQLNIFPRPGVPMVMIVGEPRIAQEILKDPLSTKSALFHRAIDEMNNGVPSILTSNGQYWHSRRKGVSPAFSSKHIERMRTVALQKIDEWIETRLSTFLEDDQAFDVGEEMVSVLFDALVETAFEYKPSAKEKEDYLHDLETVMVEFVQKKQNPLRKMFGLFIAERRLAYFATKRGAMFAMRIIDAYRQRSNPIEDTIIDRIMKNDAYENDRQRIADMNSIIVAGHDSTAYTISFILRELARHPKEQTKLQESIKSLSREEWKQSPVLRNIVKEGMRLFPVGGNSVRSLGRDFVTDDGLFLPKGTTAIIPHSLLLRNINIFEDADSFVPSRWDNPTEDMNRAFLPFSAGKQNCVGQSLAKAEIYSIIPRICSKFELELVQEGRTESFVALKTVNTMIKAKKLS